jgi:hypothetical protein
MSQLENLDREDDVIIVIDSIGNLASKKELEDALNEKGVADMSRAKALKGLFRMATPPLSMKNIPMIAINHTYKEIGLFPKDVVSGGTGIMYSADNVWIIGRRQEKQGTEVVGYDFVINVEKSRYVKEKSKIPIGVSWAGGVQKYSGLLDAALAGGYVDKPSNGWYQRVDLTTGEVIGSKLRLKETLTADFWEPILETTDFPEFLKKTYKIGSQKSAVRVSFNLNLEPITSPVVKSTLWYQPLDGLSTYPPASAASRRPEYFCTPPAQDTPIGILDFSLT